ncbi:serine/threonine protein kinase [Chitinophaga sp. CF118]|uniref:leucine-rich repeat-containing protein kinase family protein n=1 Tax=Chitinophaga sp. CF118 TaxID=1884367 RepID=UPI0008E6F366|nr:leucine-rich repeat-containing protein kinase family protein [Chitinophaga sp. CF118]SFD16517.1 serine/threonine protein kinase [Chitinophaga sp. CF118]
MQTLKQLQNGELKGAVSLKLSEELCYFPNEIFDLAETLEILDLSFNNLSSLPPDFGRLQKLKIFFCSENLFRVLPEVLADCPLLDIVGFKSNQIETVPPRSLNPNLRWLILTNNKIEKLPEELGNCSRIQKLMLAGNRLNTLPETLSHCHNLALLRISANRLDKMPEWLLTMPKLSWLAFSGNPFSKKPVVDSLPLIDWNTLKINYVLGEGASGIISRASLYTEGEIKEVAVKVFKGTVTSDGFPEDEMTTCITAGVHPGLVKLIGQITAHPKDNKGLVMELIPENFYNLGLPPSFASCTRDIFKEGLRLTVQQVLNISFTIASVAEKLHCKGIMHGDLYAHNILIDDEGNTLFSDFGAACFYDRTDIKIASALEGLEVSAYGYLLEDLIALCDGPKEHKVIAKLSALRLTCAVSDVLSRPRFKQLKDEMKLLLTSIPI